MLQQCSFGTERLPCRLPSDSLRNSLRKHVLPNSLSCALISLAGKETKSKIRTNSSIVWAFGSLGRIDHDAVRAPSSGNDCLDRQIKTHQSVTVAKSWERQDKLALHNIKNKSFHQLLLSPVLMESPFPHKTFLKHQNNTVFLLSLTQLRKLQTKTQRRMKMTAPYRSSGDIQVCQSSENFESIAPTLKPYSAVFCFALRPH